jgi:rhodanese-related sulfurtransferase
MSFDTIRINEIVKYIGNPNALIIDLRDRYEYDNGHIPGAINIPYEELENYTNRLQKRQQLIFYCDRGNISLLAARDLMKFGYNIKSLYGGIRAYHGKLDKSV